MIEKIEQSPELKELAGALAKAQLAMRAAGKDSLNPHFKSRYADLSNVWEACREPLAANNLSVIQMPCTTDDGSVALTTMLLHSSGEWVRSTITSRPANQMPQSIGSALTYLRRYALAAMVGVVASDEDDDGETATHPAAKAIQQSIPQPKAQPKPPATSQSTAAATPLRSVPTPQQAAIEAQAPLREEVVAAASPWASRDELIAELKAKHWQLHRSKEKWIDDLESRDLAEPSALQICDQTILERWLSELLDKLDVSANLPTSIVDGWEAENWPVCTAQLKTIIIRHCRTLQKLGLTDEEIADLCGVQWKRGLTPAKFKPISEFQEMCKQLAAAIRERQAA